MQRITSQATACILALVFSGPAAALPMLQIDVLGGVYDLINEDVHSSSSSFRLYTYGKVGAVDTAENHYLSAAITPKTSAGSNIGSFSVDGNTYTGADMTHGTPPIENFEGIQGHDSGDLSKHDIFDTLFLELVFKWDPNQTRSGVNVEDNPGTNPLLNAGQDLYWMAWDFDVSGMSTGIGLHFDLYTSQLRDCGNNLKNSFGGSLPESCSDVDIGAKAPFSHDATARPSDRPPTSLSASASTAAVVMAGLFGLGMGTRGRRRATAARDAIS